MPPLLTIVVLGCAVAEPSDEPPIDRLGKADGAEDCELSPMGRVVHQAAIDAEGGTIPAERILSYENLAGDALVDGEEIFGGLSALIVRAQRSVDIETFVWESDSEPAATLMAALVELEARLADEYRYGDPVVVRILVDANRLRGARAVGEPLRRSIDALALDPELVEVQVATRSAWLLGAMHQKLAIIDEEIVHIGGANVEAVHGWNDRVPWRDAAFTVHGEAARSLLHDFAQMWQDGSRWVCSDAGCHEIPNDELAASFGWGRPPLDGGCIPMIALASRPRGGLNDSVDHPVAAGFLGAMDTAQTSLSIQSPNLNDDAAKEAILNAARRTVVVRLLLSRGFNEATESLPGQGGGNADNVDALYEELSEDLGPLDACEYLQVRWYGRDGEIVDGNGPGASHAKYFSADGQLVIVGSANMDTQSWNHSGEAVLAIDDPATTRRFDVDVFEASWRASSPTGHCDVRSATR